MSDVLCIHHNDLDGRCSAAIVLKYYTEGDRAKVEFLETDYRNPPPSPDVVKGKIVVIVDFSFPPEVMGMIEKTADRLIWIDHHATAKYYPYQHLSGLRDFEDKSMAGCELTWRYFFEENMPLAVSLIGDYDKWALQMPGSKMFYEGMKLEKNGPTDRVWKYLLSNDSTESVKRSKQVILGGKIATLYRDSYCNNLCSSFGFETELDGVRAYACNQFMFGSGGFGHRFTQYPMCIAFIWSGEKWTVSMYSETVDVGVIAKTYGGGGHKGAAGFTCTELPFKKG